ncbi:MAG: hypothetical protein OXI81_01175 [Paracoccaceae bacterium]|nr:hypothetical protein [Paracoccaceae bacterium]MDE2914369.1 hypothetical protein [Paracoccaceae bacterium]
MALATNLAAALVAGAGVLFSAYAATAEESGSVRIIRTFVQDYTTIEHGDARYTSGPSEGLVTVLESSGVPFVEGTHQRITCVVYVRSTEAGIDLDAPCTVTAPSGDKWYTHSKRGTGDVETGGGGQGTIEILGGTGVYAGISGSCTYEVDYMPDNWVVTIADCIWQR